MQKKTEGSIEIDEKNFAVLSIPPSLKSLPYPCGIIIIPTTSLIMGYANGSRILYAGSSFLKK